MIATLAITVAACGGNDATRVADRAARDSAAAASSSQPITFEAFKKCLASLPYAPAAQFQVPQRLSDRDGPEPADGAIIIQAYMPRGVATAEQAEQVARNMAAATIPSRSTRTPTLEFGLPGGAVVGEFRESAWGPSTGPPRAGAINTSRYPGGRIPPTTLVRQWGYNWSLVRVIWMPTSAAAEQVFQEIRMAGTQYVPDGHSYGSGVSAPQTVVRAHNIVAISHDPQQLTDRWFPCMHKEAVAAFAVQKASGVETVVDGQLYAYVLPALDSESQAIEPGNLDGDLKDAAECIHDRSDSLSFSRYGGSDANGDWPRGSVHVSGEEEGGGTVGGEVSDEAAKSRVRAIQHLRAIGGLNPATVYRHGSTVITSGDADGDVMRQCFG